MTNDETIVSTVFVVDDHPMVREGIASSIARTSDLRLCGEADHIDAALQQIPDLVPDLVIVDISLRGGNGIDLIKQLKSRFPTMKMLVHSMYDESIYAERALRAGAMGYIDKQTAHETVVEAMRAVLAGKTFVSPEMTDRIVRGRIGAGSTGGQTAVDGLSDRELEVLTLIGRGRMTRSIANELHLSVNTIDTYREKLKSKLNLPNGAELSRFAALWVLRNE